VLLKTALSLAEDPVAVRLVNENPSDKPALERDNRDAVGRLHRANGLNVKYLAGYSDHGHIPSGS
jgi:hypothetical protein